MRHGNSRIDRLMAVLTAASIAVAGAALLGMAAVEAWQVFARYVLNDSPGWTEPVALLLMNTAMMFGAAAAVRGETHFGFFVLVHSAGVIAQRLMLSIARLIAAATGAVLAAWGAQLLVDGWSVPMAGAALPQGIAFLPISAGGVMIALFALERLWRAPPPARASADTQLAEPQLAEPELTERPRAARQRAEPELTDSAPPRSES